MNITVVCKGCQERYPACWGSCPKYLEARAELDKKKAVIHNSYKAEKNLNAVQYHGLRRAQKARKEKE